jgi:AmiR/NasT family two-component response regulator
MAMPVDDAYFSCLPTTRSVTRELLGQAQGIQMERERITSDHAYDILCRASQHLNIKLRDVAQDLVETG